MLQSASIFDGLLILSQIKSRQVFIFATYGHDGRMLNWKNNEINDARNLQSTFPLSTIVVTWGSQNDGGNSNNVQNQLHNIKMIYSTAHAFAALKNDETAVTWGDQNHGGNSNNVQNQLHNVKMIYSTNRAFAALKNDETVVTWGYQRYGGNSNNVQNIKMIYSTGSAFAALN